MTINVAIYSRTPLLGRAIARIISCGGAAAQVTSSYETIAKLIQSEGVKFVRSRISEIKEHPETKDLTVKYVSEDGSLRKDTFNLVVLAHGLEAPKGNSALALAAGIGLNQYGFCETGLFSPLDTTRKGIFVAGGFQAPISIPDSVIQAGGAAIG